MFKNILVKTLKNAKFCKKEQKMMKMSKKVENWKGGQKKKPRQRRENALGAFSRRCRGFFGCLWLDLCNVNGFLWFFATKLARSGKGRGAPQHARQNAQIGWKIPPKSFQKATSKSRSKAVAKLRSKSTQNAQKSWPDAGQELAKSWPGTGQKPARNWPEMSQKVIKKCSQTGSRQNGGIFPMTKPLIWPM